MACIQHIYVCSFLLAVIASHDFLFTEGRQLKTMEKQKLNSFEDDKGFIYHEKETIGSGQVPRGPNSDIKVTGPIASPDISGTKEIFPPMSSNGPNPSPEFGSSVTVYINGFQPTTPGNSPGVGHSYVGHKEENERKAPSTVPSVAYSHEANTDDFRPTGPGRSPGVGHSNRNTKAEPNA